MIKPIMTTTIGYTVSGCQQSYNPRFNRFEGVSGRVRVVKGDPSRDEMVKWDNNWQPINHNYGALVAVSSGKGTEINGFNLFSDLIK